MYTKKMNCAIIGKKKVIELMRKDVPFSVEFFKIK